MGENTYKQCNQQGLNLQNIQTTKQQNKIKKAIEKWAKT